MGGYIYVFFFGQPVAAGKFVSSHVSNNVVSAPTNSLYFYPLCLMRVKYTSVATGVWGAVTVTSRSRVNATASTSNHRTSRRKVTQHPSVTFGRMIGHSKIRPVHVSPLHLNTPRQHRLLNKRTLSPHE